MKKNPTVSILLVVWNEIDSLDTFFESIKNQTFSDYEIICVTNGSPEDVSQKVKEWQKQFTNNQFTLIENKENIGLTKALNMALEKARGEFIARLDPDDYWTKEKLQKQLDFFEKNPDHGIVGTNHINDFKGNKKEVKLFETDKEIKEKLFRKNPFAHSCIMARTDLIKKVGGYDENVLRGQDYNLWLRCAPLTKFHNLQEFLCVRNVSSGISVEKQNEQMWQSIKTRVKFIRKYKYPLRNYLYLIEPLLIILTPNFIKKLKRKYL